MKISVIIPTHNSEATIVECVNSVISQTLKPNEIIIVDSSDNKKTLELVDKKFKDISAIKIVKSSKANTAFQCSLGIENATSDWVCFVDSDDVVSDKYLSKFCELETRFKTDVVMTGTSKFNSGSDPFQFYKESSKNLLILKNTKMISLRKNIYSTLKTYSRCGKLIKRDCLIKNLDVYKKTNCNYWEDVVFSYLLFNNAASVLVNKSVTYFYRNNGKSVSKSSRDADKYIKDGVSYIDSVKNIPNIPITNEMYFPAALTIMDCLKTKSAGDYNVFKSFILQNNESINEIFSFTKASFFHKKNLIFYFLIKLHLLHPLYWVLSKRNK